MKRTPKKPSAVTHSPIKRLLYKRRETAFALNISIAQVRRLEDEGLLDKMKLRGRSGSLVHHRVEQVEALANGER